MNARNKQQRTALMKAASRGDLDFAALLLAAGANLFLQDSTGKTALDWARMSHHVVVSDFLEAAAVKALAREVRDKHVKIWFCKCSVRTPCILSKSTLDTIRRCLCNMHLNIEPIPPNSARAFKLAGSVCSALCLFTSKPDLSSEVFACMCAY